MPNDAIDALQQVITDVRVSTQRKVLDDTVVSPAAPQPSMVPTWLLGACGVLLLSLAFGVAWLVVSEPFVATVPFDTDEADHANAALELFYAARTGDPTAIARSITRQSFYPPLHSIAAALSYSVFGVTLWASRIPSVIFYLATGVFLALAVSGGQRSRIGFGGLLAAALTFTSPLLVVNAGLSMLEAMGGAIVAVLLWMLSRERSETLSGTAPALLAVSALLTKYNYGLVLCPAVVLGLSRLSQERGLPRLTLTRGAIRAGVVMGVAILLWILVCDRAALWHFFVGHPSYRPRFSAEHILFYPRAWIFDYSIHPIVGIAALLFAFLGAVRFWQSVAVRVASYAVMLSALIHFVSTTDEKRHILVAAVCIWYLAGVGLAAALSASTTFRCSLAFASLPLVVTVWGLFSLPRVQPELRRALEGTPEYGALMDYIVSKSAPGEALLVNGFSDSLSLEGLRWKMAAAHKVPYTTVRIDGYPFRDSRYRTQTFRKRNIDTAGTFPELASMPLPELLQTGVYDTVVNITRASQNRSKMRPASKRLARALRLFPAEEQSFGGRKVEIVHLRASN